METINSTPLPGQIWESNLHPGNFVRILKSDGLDVEYIMFATTSELSEHEGYCGGADIGEFMQFFHFFAISAI